MARTAKAAPSTAVVSWDDRLAAEAEVASSMEQNSGGGQFFSMRGGTLSFNDAAMPGNQMACVILDGIMENVFYEGKFDPNNPIPPTCFAFGRDEESMVPHKAVFEAEQEQSQACKSCPQNEWGSADTGRGKACRNTRRLALVTAGSFDAQGRFQAIDDDQHFASTTIAYMKLPVTSIKGYASFVKQVAGVMKRPPFGIFTRIKVEPDPKNQFRVVFEPLGAIPDELMEAVVARNQEAKTLIDFPYNLEMQERAPAPAPKGRGAAVQKPARGRKY